MKYRVEQILEIKKNLAALPEVPIDKQEFVTARGAVELLAEVIGRLQKKGYSNEKIATLLREQGVQLSLITLRQYLARTGSKPASKKQAGSGKKTSLRTTTNPTKKIAEKKVATSSVPPKGGFSVRGDTEEL